MAGWEPPKGGPAREFTVPVDDRTVFAQRGFDGGYWVYNRRWRPDRPSMLIGEVRRDGKNWQARLVSARGRAGWHDAVHLEEAVAKVGELWLAAPPQ